MKIILLVVLVSAVFSASLRGSQNPLPQLLQMKDRSTFTQNLISSLELHLTTGGKVEEVITYVKEALATTQSERETLSAEYGSEMERYDTEISGLNGDIRQMEGTLEQTIIEISQIGKDISALEVQQANIQNELDALSQREANVRAARDNDITTFASRQQRDSRAISALEDIIPQLNDLLLGGTSLVEKTQEQLNTYLRNKDISDPIRTLVQTSMKFNKAKLSTVIQKLEDILEAVQVGKQIDEENEATSEIRFNALIAEIETIRAGKQQELSMVNAQLNVKNSDLITSKANRDRLVINIESTTKLRDATQQTRDLAEVSFKQRISDADASIQALRDALSILEGNVDTLQESEQQADNDLA